MGVSTDGILVFGIDLGEELPEFLEEFEDVWWDFTNSISGETEYEKRSEFRKNYPLDLVTYCSHEYPMYILAINGTETNVSRGYTEEIDPDDMKVPEDKIAALKAFCEEYDIEWQEPKWLLASMWG